MDDVSERTEIPTIIFDFDGTLALGTGPLEAYAREVAARVDEPEILHRAQAAVSAYEAGDARYRDGYDAVAQVAVDCGVPAHVLGAAYDASRALLGSPSALVAAPDGLSAFLRRLGDGARLVLATNAPGDGVTGLLEEWGVAGAFDSLHFRIGKPDGLAAVVRDALTLGPVLSVGDIVDFDLRPAAALGADTALVGPTASRPRSTDSFALTMRGRTLSDLYDAILDWAASSTASLHVPNTTPERQI